MCPLQSVHRHWPSMPSGPHVDHVGCSIAPSAERGVGRVTPSAAGVALGGIPAQTEVNRRVLRDQKGLSQRVCHPVRAVTEAPKPSQRRGYCNPGMMQYNVCLSNLCGYTVLSQPSPHPISNPSLHHLYPTRLHLNLLSHHHSIPSPSPHSILAIISSLPPSPQIHPYSASTIPPAFHSVSIVQH